MGKHIAPGPVPTIDREPGSMNPPSADLLLKQDLARMPLRDDAFRVWKRFAFWTVMAMKLVARVAMRLGRQLTADDLERIVRVDPLETNSRELKCAKCGMSWTPLVRAFVQADGTFSERSEHLTGDFFHLHVALPGKPAKHKLVLACSNPREGGETCWEIVKEATHKRGLTWQQGSRLLAEHGVTARL